MVVRSHRGRKRQSWGLIPAVFDSQPLSNCSSLFFFLFLLFSSISSLAWSGSTVLTCPSLSLLFSLDIISGLSKIGLQFSWTTGPCPLISLVLLVPKIRIHLSLFPWLLTPQTKYRHSHPRYGGDRKLPYCCKKIHRDKILVASWP